MRLCRALIILFVVGITLKGANITLPLDGGNIVIRNPRFFERAKGLSSNHELILTFVLDNHTSSTWDKIDLEFKIGGFCKDGLPPLYVSARQWSHLAHVGYFSRGSSSGKSIEEVVSSFSGKATDCEGEIIKARLVLAVNCPTLFCSEIQERRIEGKSGESLDVEPELQAGLSARKERAAAMAEEQRKERKAEAEAREAKEATEKEEADRQEKLEAERKKRDAKLTSDYAKAKAKMAADAKAHAEMLAALPIVDSGAPATFFGADRKCSEQFVQALSMEGLEKRKKLAELVTFGCGFTDVSRLHIKRAEVQGSYCRVLPMEGKHQDSLGWVPCIWIKGP